MTAAPRCTILVPEGTSTEGNAALQIGRMKDATMISTTRSEANFELLLASGADHVFVDDGGDIGGFLLKSTDGMGLNASFDPIGADFMQACGKVVIETGLQGNTASSARRLAVGLFL